MKFFNSSFSVCDISQKIQKIPLPFKPHKMQATKIQSHTGSDKPAVRRQKHKHNTANLPLFPSHGGMKRDKKKGKTEK